MSLESERGESMKNQAPDEPIIGVKRDAKEGDRESQRITAAAEGGLTPLDDAMDDPRFSIGATINESLVAPLTASQESRDAFEDGTDPRLDTPAHELSPVPHQGKDSDLGAPEDRLALSSSDAAVSEVDTPDDLDAWRDHEDQQRAEAQAGLASEGSMAPIGTSAADQVRDDDATRRVSARTAWLRDRFKAQPFMFALGLAGLGFAAGRGLVPLLRSRSTKK